MSFRTTQLHDIYWMVLIGLLLLDGFKTIQINIVADELKYQP